MKRISACPQHSMFDGLEAQPTTYDRPGRISARLAK